MSEIVCKAGARWKGCVLDIKDVHSIFNMKKGVLAIGPDATFIRMESVLDNRATHYINCDGKCPC